MKKYLFLLVLVSLTACKTPCSDPNSLASRAGGYLADKWSCQHRDVMQADMNVWFANHGLCQQPVGMTGPISSIVCGLVLEVVRKSVAEKVPVSWGCDSSLVGKDMVVVLSALCGALPVEPKPASK